MFQKLLQPFLARTYPCSVEEVRHNTQKETRIIDALEPVMNQHRLIVDPMVIQEDYDTAMKQHSADKARDYMIMYQLSRITKDRGSLKHDDRLESLGMAVRYFTDKMAVDQEKSEATRNDAWLDSVLDKRSRKMKDAMIGSKQHLNGMARWLK